MATSVTLNSTSYSIPATGEDDWGTDVSNYLIALSTGVLSKAGGAFTLTADTDFGANYGLKSIYYKSRGTVSGAGVLRLANDESVGWRNAANSANLELKVNSSDVLEFNSNPVFTLALGTADHVLKMNSGGTAYEFGAIANANVDASAAIAYSKLALSDSIVNADINASAAIAYSKLNLTDSVENADINASAAIDHSKMAALTASRVLVTDGSGFSSASSVSTTTLGYLDATSSIQDQLDVKLDDFSSTNDNRLVRTDGTAGEAVQESGVTVDDSNNMSGVADLDAGTFSAAEISTPSSPASGKRRLYPKTDGWYDLDDAGIESKIGSGGSGGGGINFIENPDFEANTDGWTASNTPATITRVTTGDVARGNGSAEINFTSSSTTSDYVEYQFELPEGYANRPLRLSFLHIDGTDDGYADDQLEVVLVKDPGGTEVEYLPYGGAEIKSRDSWYQFETYVNCGAADTYALRFKDVTGSTAMEIRVDDIELGPQDLVLGVPIDDGTIYTLDGSEFANSTGLTITGTAWYKRIGGDLYLDVVAYFSGTGSDSSDLALELDVITGKTITVAAGEYPGGTVRVDNGTTTSRSTQSLTILGNGTTDLKFTSSSGGSAFAGTAFGSSGTLRDQFHLSAKLPINEWAGSSAYLSTARPQEVWNSNSGTSSDSTSFAYGPTGASFPNSALSGTITKRVRFLTAPRGGRITLLVDPEGTDNWQEPIGRWRANGVTGDGIDPFDGANIGFGRYERINETDFDVTIGRYRVGTSDWNSNTGAAKWKLVHIPGQVQVVQPLPMSEVVCDTGNGWGSVDTKIRRFTNATTVGGDITRSSSAANGDTFTINRSGVYAITYNDDSATNIRIGVSLNSSNLTTNINLLSASERITQADGGSNRVNIAATLRLNVGDVIRAHGTGANERDSSENQFRITQVVAL